MDNDIDINKRHKTRYTGVFWRYSKSNGKIDKSYYISYKIMVDDKKKNIETLVGKASNGFNITHVKTIYDDTINALKLDLPLPIKKKNRKRFTFSNAFEKYFIFAKENKKTWKKDEELYTNHLAEFHDEELHTLNQKSFNDLKTEKLKKYSDSTVSGILGVARATINFAINNELIKNYSNPIAKGRVYMSQPDNQKEGYLTKKQAIELLEKLKERPTSRMYDLTVFLLFTGARFSEVASLTWNNIDLEDKLIYFKKTKKGNPRHIPITKLIKQVLETLPKNNILLFPSDNNKIMIQMPKQWQEIVDKLIKNNKQEIEKGETALTQEQKLLLKSRITTHSLRHTYATWLAKSKKFTLLDIKYNLGHKTTQMTERYSHYLEEDRQEKHDKIFEEF